MVTVLEAINEYKKFVDEISLMLTAFASVNGNERNGYLTELGWTEKEVRGYQIGVMRYDPVERIKSALISDMPDKDTLQNRLWNVWYELCGACHFSDSNYFPVFDGSLLSHENKTLLESLTKIEGARYAYEVLTRLEQIVHWANIRISNVYKYLVELSQFSGLPRCTKDNAQDGTKQSEKPNVAEDEAKQKQQMVKVKQLPKFSDIIQYPDKDKLLERLHYLIDGKGGASVGAVLQKAKMDGYLTRYPRREEFVSEFDLIGSWQGISNYFNENKNTCLAKSADVIIFDAEIRD